MQKIKYTVNTLLYDHFSEYCSKYYVSDFEKKIVNAIISCRTEKLGGRVETCDTCGHTITLYNSCRNRHCPQCQSMKKEQWVIDRKSEVLPFQYFHSVFTVPEELNPLFKRNKKKLYKFLFEIVKKTLIKETEEYIDAKIGFFMILHTWGQLLNLHPHIHCVIPGGGKRKDGKWKTAGKNYLVPVEKLSGKFMYNFLDGLKKLHENKELNTNGTSLDNKVVFQKLIDKLFDKEWVVYLKESFNNHESVIEYLSKYTHRIAISNYRIKEVKNGFVTFTYRDYKDDNKVKPKTLHVMEFIRRFLMHIVPERFVRIRYYGLLSHRNKSKNVEDCYDFYKKKIKKREEKQSYRELFKIITGKDICTCPNCKKGLMVISKELIAVSDRSPPRRRA